jgi:hypothetical protein
VLSSQLERTNALGDTDELFESATLLVAANAAGAVSSSIFIGAGIGLLALVALVVFLVLRYRSSLSDYEPEPCERPGSFLSDEDGIWEFENPVTEGLTIVEACASEACPDPQTRFALGLYE